MSCIISEKYKICVANAVRNIIEKIKNYTEAKSEYHTS
jgi:hypothetical protein